MNISLTDYSERERLTALIAELYPDWTLNGGGVGMGGFDVSFDLPDETTITFYGEAGSAGLKAYGSGVEGEELELTCEHQRMIDKIKEAFKAGAFS